MALSVNTNIASLNAQRNLTKSGSDLNVSLQRLSTGLRINSAKDDAAGLAISERFTTQIRGMNVAIRNSNDGISLAQTAEGALGGLTDSLQRIRELAVQSANATNSVSDRQALQDEVSQLLLEIDRVARETSFNGVNLLDGSFISQQFQVGANAGQTITVDAIANARLTALGETFAASATGTAVDTTAFDGTNLTINGTNVTASLDDNSGSDNADASAKAKAEAINNSNIAGVTATAGTTTNTGTSITAAGLINGTTDQVLVNGVNIGTVDAGANVLVQSQNLAAAIDALDGISAASDGTDAVIITADDGRNVTVQTVGAIDANTGFGDNATTTTVATLTVDSTTADGLTLTGTQATTMTLDTPTAATSTIGIDQLTVADVAGANTAMAAVDSALGTLNGARATLGAVQSRFETVISNLSITSENLTASRGRILDADFAAETANLTKSQILQQAGVAILAQANGLPQLALSLLQ